MTPLQQAAQAVIHRWDTTDWKNAKPTAGYIADMRMALEDEQAQAVEPVAYFLKDPSGHFHEVSTKACYPGSLPLFLRPQKAVTSGERAELIAECRAYAEQGMSSAAIKLARRAADMLEAMATIRESLTVHAREGNMPDCWVVVKDGRILGTHDEPAHIDGLQAVRYVPAQQAKQVPMTDEEVIELIPGMIDCMCDPYDNQRNGDDYSSVPVDMLRLARAIEAAHNIKAKP